MAGRSAAGAGPAEVATTCPYCGVGCGVLAADGADGAVSVRGDPSHPANGGRLCSKGAALADTLDLEGRLLYPSVDGRRVSWDRAVEHVARRLLDIRDRYGPEAIAFYVSGQLLTEDYYVANKLAKGFIGTGNIDTNSRLCMASAVAGHVRAFGADAVPGCYEDLESAELVVLVGSNTAWCHPVLYQRLVQAREQHPGCRVAVVDPRRTATCETADLHLPIRPGTDVVLFNGLLDYLRRHDVLDYGFLERNAEGFAEALEAARQSAPSVPHVSRVCGVPEESVDQLYRLFAAAERVVTLFSQGVNQSSSGTDKVNAIINCHLATGRIGRPGMGPFSVTGQPNAMGGREVGGMANQLAAHMSFDQPGDVARVSRFWGAPRMVPAPGLKAVDLFEAVGRSQVRAVWVMGTNPAVTLPDVSRVRRALRGCGFVVVSDCVHTDTTACADVLLPAATWGEKDGTVTNSERRISRQRAFRACPGEARPDWWIITQVARRMGFARRFPYERAAQIFREHAALSGFENSSGRVFDIGALAELSDDGYDALRPVQWPVTGKSPGGTTRLFIDGRFPTPSGRARMVATPPRAPGHLPDQTYPLVLNTGRVRDQWHTMTRTGSVPRLTEHKAEPYVEIHPGDAAAYGITDGGLARVVTQWGSMLARVALSQEQRPGSLFVPMHWSDRYAAQGCADALVNPVTDPVSGQPESKHTPARVEPYEAQWYAFALSRRPLLPEGADYWVRAAGRGFWRYELAGRETPSDWRRWAQALLGAGDDRQWVDYADSGRGRYRGAYILDRRLEACIFSDRRHELPGRGWLAGLFETDVLSDEQRAGLLTGAPGNQGQDEGRQVCACFGVGEKTLRDVIAGEGLTSVEAVGRRLKAGTNCGSCIPELKALLAAGGGTR